MLHEVPPWCRWRRGDGRFLVVAPHGGICARDLVSPPPPATLRGNDLHTLGVAEEIAARLSAGLISNQSTDRNRLDLNRISEVERDAPWFLILMRRLLEETLARHGAAEVLFVHGWHVVQPRCDLGIGARLERVDEARRVARRLSVTPGYALSRLEALRAACAAQGIAAGYGERWPAAHRNNVMRLFRRVEAVAGDGPAAALARLAAASRVQAVQIELGAPLRWPGRWRERFVGALADALADRVPEETRKAAEPPGRDRRPRPASRQPSAVPALHPVAVQGYDAAAGAGGLGVVAGIGTIGHDEVGARLLLFPGGQRLLLFTGHARLAGQRADRPRVGGLEGLRHDGVLELRFHGPVLDIPDASLHFRRERAQLEARVVDADVQLRLAASAEEPYGSLVGDVVAGDERWRVETHGFADPVLGRPGTAVAHERTRLTAALGARLGVVAELGSGAARLASFGEERAAALEVTGEVPRLDLQPERLCRGLALPLRGRPALACVPRNHLTIVRPAPGGRVRITFGVAEFGLGEALTGGGFYEHAVPVEARDATREPAGPADEASGTTAGKRAGEG